MPYAGLVSRRAVEFYGDKFAWNPVSSGPFILTELQRDYRMLLERNPAYRKEFFKEAESEADRSHPLPLVDKIVCSLIKQPLSNWLLFLQGELDMSALDKDNFDAVVGDDLKLIPALAKCGIKLVQVPEFQVNYVGFSFTDPLLADNLKLRQAISLAYNVPLRVKHANYGLLPANGPIPPGVSGHDASYQNPWSKYDLEKARELLREAGYPDGIDPKTGKPLQLSFDQNGTSATHRQIAELMVNDMRKLGIEIKPSMNESPRFFKKLSDGQLQLFRLSWSGDYPDAENFLQLFYGPNAGSSNRVCYRDPAFDKMFAEIISMPDSPERTEKYRKMSVYLTEKCPWIFESYPVSYRLTHAWLENYLPHDFAFSRWKYLSLDPSRRTEQKASFHPLEMKDLQK